MAEKSTPDATENIPETIISFDDILFFEINSITISPYRYAGVIFYSPYFNNNTYLTWNYRYSYPNSLIVGYNVWNPYNNNYDIYSSDTMVIEFAQPARDVSFLWGRNATAYSGGWIDIYTDNYVLVTTVPVNVSAWSFFSLNQYSQRIKMIKLRRPYVSDGRLGAIFLDNFQFTPATTQSPVGTLESVSVQSEAAVGWSADPDSPTANNNVNCLIDGVYAGTVVANLAGSGPPNPPYSGNHRYSFPIPNQYLDGNNHQISCYGIDHTGGDPYVLLSGSPKTFNLPPRVQSVVFEAISNELVAGVISSSFLDHPAYGLSSQRIFPDRLNPNDPVSRKSVRVKAVVGQPNVTVYFKNFDVDDPSSNASIDDNGILGNDNREGRILSPPFYPASASGMFSNCTPTAYGCSAITGPNGEASAFFTVTKQPGDNFVVAASSNQAYLHPGVSVNGTELKDSANSTLPTSQAKRTELLTVWRRLHIEVDSMGQAEDNFITGYIREKGTYVGSEPKWVEIYPTSGEPLEYRTIEEHAYKETLGGNQERLSYGGRIEVAGVQNLHILDNEYVEGVNHPIRSKFKVVSLSGNVYLHANQPVKIFDDDDFDGDDGDNKNGDSGDEIDLVLNTTLSRMQPSDDRNINSYADAYIVPEYGWAEAFKNDDVPFVTNSACDAVNCAEQRSVITTYSGSLSLERDDFWVGYLLVAYQAESNADVDSVGFHAGHAPMRYSGLPINVDEYNESNNAPGGFGALIFLESMRDRSITSLPQPFTDPTTRTAVHEMGHQFGLAHNENMNPTLGGVMTTVGDLFFTPNHVNMMRWRVKSPGEAQ